MAVGLFAILIFAIVILSIGGMLFVVFGHKLKGSITLTLPKQGYHPGHPISGMMTVAAKKQLGPGRLFTSLICTEEWWEWDTDADGDRSRERRTRELYRHDVDVQPAFSIAGGQEETIPFVIETPQIQAPQPDAPSSLPGWAQNIAQAAKFLTQRESEIYWEIVGHYDIPGLDLVSRQRVPLNYPHEG